MANSKNTIQNIPLTGELCINTLKTDVKQFEGYNEKNTTVFGGELTNIRSKKSVSYTDYKTKHLHNSKGDDFEIDLVNGTIKKGDYVYRDDVKRVIRNINLSSYLKGYDVYWAALAATPRYGEPLEIYFVAPFYDGVWLCCMTIQPNSSSWVVNGVTRLCLEEERDILLFESGAYKLYSSGGRKVFACFVQNTKSYGPYVTGEICVFEGNHSYIGGLSHIHLDDGLIMESPPVINIVDNYVLLNTLSGYEVVNDSNYHVHKYAWSIDSNGHVTYIRPEDFPDGYGDYQVTGLPRRGDKVTCSVAGTSQRPSCYEVSAWSVSSYRSDFDANNNFDHGTNSEWTFNGSISGVTGYTGTVGDGVPSLKKVVGDFWNGISVYTLHTYVISISLFGVPVCTPTSIENNNITFTYDDISNQDPTKAYAEGVTYKSNGSWVYTGFIQLKENEYQYINDDMYDNLVIDNRYILCLKDKTWYPHLYEVYSRTCFLFDIETRTSKDITLLGYILSEFPVTSTSFTETTGAVYAGGYNSAFEISKSPFTGYLPNPTVVTGIKGYFKKWSRSVPAEINTYLSIGDSVMSAEYNGTNPEYDGTKYSIDANANVILPFSASSKIIKGYSNNDLIDTGSSVYPLIYYNNTNKLYSYYLLSSIEGMKHVFALQSQQYGVTDENILAVTINNGVLSSVNTVAYVKDMTFLGTLPTSAVFYSKLNKTFYRFTGDSVLSKMFEASDIDEIGIVGQNPASLSLWICTDKGVYVISDTDMYKLDYKADNVSFCDSFVIIDEDDFDTEQNKYSHTSNRISIYDIGDGAEEQPIKLQTKYYGLGSELKASYDCWYIRLHHKKHKAGKLKLKVNTITNTSFETEEKTFDIEPSMYDANSQIFIRYQPKYQSAVATQLELESDIPIYQISLGINQTDATAQVSKFNF